MRLEAFQVGLTGGLLALVSWLVVQFNKHKALILALYATVQSTVSANGSKLITHTLPSHGTGTGGVAGGAGVTSPVKLPVYNQLNDPLPNGEQDAYATSDCGEECAAEIIRACRGVVLSAGDIRYQLGGADRTGLTTGSDLVEALRLSDVPAHSASLDVASAWPAIAQSLAGGKPVALLVLWQNTSTLHWVVATDLRGGVLYYNDPWGGVRASCGKSAFAKIYQGVAVFSDQAVRPEYMG
jgi:hypothetical protein